MDVSTPPLGPSAAPRAVPDLRPAADAAATARITKPPAAMAQGETRPVQPVSVSQSALVSRSLIDGAANDPVRVSSEGARLTVVDPSQRVLKPFGVSMLPSNEREAPASSDGNAAEAPDADEAERGPAPADADRP